MSDSVSPLIVWDQSFETGVKVIDEQHMILVHSLNEASQTLAKDRGNETMDKITQNLLSYAIYHFETEEELMLKYGYDTESAEDAARHQEQHRSFSETVVLAREGISNGTPMPAEKLLDFLNDWLVNHILKTDKKLGEFIVSRL